MNNVTSSVKPEVYIRSASAVMSTSACLCVCLSAYLLNYTSDLQQFCLHHDTYERGYGHRHRIDKYLDTLLANQPISDGEATDRCKSYSAAILRRKYSGGFTFYCRYGPCGYGPTLAALRYVTYTSGFTDDVTLFIYLFYLINSQLHKTYRVPDK